MKKIVSLLMACLMVLSIGMIPAFATTETELYGTLEEALTEGDLTVVTPASAGGFAGTTVTLNDTTAKEFEDGNGVAVKKDGDNVYFELDGYNAGTSDWRAHKLYRDDYDSVGTGANSTRVKKYSALVSLPSVTEGVTNVFGKGTWNKADSDNAFKYKNDSKFGVKLQHGGAYYYNADTEEYVNFVADGTMEADRYYRIEAISDFRSRTSTSAAGPYYMRAFVYDGNTLLGETGWVHPANEGYTYDLDGRAVYIESYGYPEKSVIKIDEFEIYKLTALPTYTVANDIEIKVSDNYITTPSAQSYRTLGQVFQKEAADEKYIYQDSNYKASRVQLDVRFHSLNSTDQYDLLRFYSGGAQGINGPGVYKSPAIVFEGTVLVKGTSLTVNSYNSETSKYDTPVALTNDATSLTIEANKWYTLVWDIDYSKNYDAPSATLAIKGEDGNILATTSAEYTVSKMPIASGNTKPNVSTILYCASYYKSRTIDIDNTKLYVADTLANLDTESKHVIWENDFESYAKGTTFNDIVKPKFNNGGHIATYGCTDAVLTYDTKRDFEYAEEVEVPAKATRLKFTYTNAVPNENINYKNIKLVSGDAETGYVEYVGGVDYTVTPGNDGGITGAETSKTFTVEMPDLIGNTDYAIRLMRGLSDYNTTVTVDNAIKGVSADKGLYKDITFNTNGDDKETAVASNLINASGAAVTSLTAGDVIKGKVIAANGGADAINGHLILGIYDGNELVTALVSENAFSASAGATISASTPEYTVAKDGLTAKVFVWNNLEELKPILSTVVVPVA